MGYTDKEKQKAAQRAWATKRRRKSQEIVRAYKLEQGCKDCGYNEHHAALEFDHVRGEKVANVANLMLHETALWEEIKKCEVVCSNCHSIRTFNRQVALADKAF